jgi:hypothetical protein
MAWAVERGMVVGSLMRRLMRVKMETQVKCGEKSPYCFISKSKIGGAAF